MIRTFLKKWILIIVLLVFSLLIGVKTGRASFHIFFWFLTLTVVLSLFWIALEYVFAAMRLERVIVKKVEEDDTIEIEVVVINKSLIPLSNIVIEDNLNCTYKEERKKHALIEFLGPLSSLAISYACTCPLRGKYYIGPLAVYFFDPLGLFFFKKTFPVLSELYVYPKTFRINKFPELVRGVLPWFGIETTRASGDEDEFFGIREYKAGDPIQRIHWLSTARKNKLIVKQFQRQSYYRATILFNLEQGKNFGEGKERVAEYMIKIAASVAKHLTEKGIDISLQVIVHSGEIVRFPFNKGEEHMEEIMKFLTLAQADSRVSIAEIFEEFHRYIPNDSTLVAIMSDTDWSFFPSLLMLEQKNVSVIPLVVMTTSFLYQEQKQNIEKEIAVKLSTIAKIKPVCFSRGDHLEEKFLR